MGVLPTTGNDGTCQKDIPAFSVNPSAKGSVCSGLKFMRITMDGPNVEPKSLRYNNLIVSQPHGNTSIPYRTKRLTVEGWMGILYNGSLFHWEFEESGQITNITYDAKTYFVDTTDYYYVEHKFLQKTDGFMTSEPARNSSPSLPDPHNGAIHGDFYFNNATNTMTYLVSRDEGPSKDMERDRRTGVSRKITFRTYRCLYTDCIPPVPPTIPPKPTVGPDAKYNWSDTEAWKNVPVGSGGHPNDTEWGLPNEGVKIVIPAGMHMIVDIKTPSLGQVHVFGVLEFADTMDHAFNTTIIYIGGGSVIAGESKDKPFTHKLTILLRGSLDPKDPDNTDMPMPWGTPNVGWKAIGVFGKLQLHGQLTGKSWVKLGATAAPGDTQVTLAEAADSSWKDKQVRL